jgi:hypothetical protein
MLVIVIRKTSSLWSGSVSFDLYVYCRRLLFDDAFGVGEALNETAFGEGLVARGKHRDVTFGDISTILK